MKIPVEIFTPNSKRPVPVYTERDGLIDIDGDLNLSGRSLMGITLKYGIVNGNCLLNSNKLTSLAGSPRVVTKGFYCYKNNLTSLDGCPSEVHGDFYCANNGTAFTEEDVLAVCNVKGEIYV